MLCLTSGSAHATKGLFEKKFVCWSFRKFSRVYIFIIVILIFHLLIQTNVKAHQLGWPAPDLVWPVTTCALHGDPYSKGTLLIRTRNVITLHVGMELQLVVLIALVACTSTRKNKLVFTKENILLNQPPLSQTVMAIWTSWSKIFLHYLKTLNFMLVLLVYFRVFYQ